MCVLYTPIYDFSVNYVKMGLKNCQWHFFVFSKTTNDSFYFFLKVAQSHIVGEYVDQKIIIDSFCFMRKAVALWKTVNDNFFSILIFL